MPGTSTPTILYKRQNIGMGFDARYVVSVSNPEGQLTARNMHEVIDTKRKMYHTHHHFKLKYDKPLVPEDVDENREQELIQQYPNFSKKIHKLVEKRRKYLAAQEEETNQGEGGEHKRCIIT